MERYPLPRAWWLGKADPGDGDYLIAAGPQVGNSLIVSKMMALAEIPQYLSWLMRD
jgi:hypothetical protein